jgi:hypothetical protein
LGSCLGVGHTPYTHMALGRFLPQCWAHLAHTWRLGFYLWVEHFPAHTEHLGCLTGSWAHPSTHVVLGHAKNQLFLGLVCCKTQNNFGSLVLPGPKQICKTQITLSSTIIKIQFFIKIKKNPQQSANS